VNHRITRRKVLPWIGGAGIAAALVKPAIGDDGQPNRGGRPTIAGAAPESTLPRGGPSGRDGAVSFSSCLILVGRSVPGCASSSTV
jgi:hypothetical protein